MSQRHRPAISRALVCAASAATALWVSGCSDITLPGTVRLSTAELLILRQQAGAAAPGSASFWVYNSRATTRTLRHSDQALNLYLELVFPFGSLAQLDGQPIGSEDSVLVTVDPRPGEYGFTLSPLGLIFTGNGAPAATFSFAVHGDLSVADGSSTYASRQAYADALDLWQEVTVDQWQVATGSQAAGSSEVRALLATGGNYLLAAPR